MEWPLLDLYNASIRAIFCASKSYKSSQYDTCFFFKLFETDLEE